MIFDATVPGSMLRRRLAFEDGVMHEYVDQTNMQDCLDLNTAWRNAERPSSSLWHSDYVKVASIPLELAEVWFKREGINIFRASEEDWARLLLKLNDNEYNKLRTAPGRL